LRSKVSLPFSPAAPLAQGKTVSAEKIAAGELFRRPVSRRMYAGCIVSRETLTDSAALTYHRPIRKNVKKEGADHG